MELKTIRYDTVAPGVALVTLDRPDRLNSWTGRMHAELRWVLAEAEADDAVRVVVVTGAGRGFCSGADARALETHVDRGGYDAGTPDDMAQPGYGVDEAFDADFAWMLGLDTVLIAAVNGPAAGIGLVLACWCDLRFIAADAKLTAAHGRLNLPAEYGLSWLLPRLIGRTHANDVLLSSRVFLGAEAGEMGLANAVVDDAADVVPRALEYASSMVASVSPEALATTKRQLSLDLLHSRPATSVRAAQALLDTMTTHADYVEAVRAFGDRDTPRWTQPPRAVAPRDPA